MSQINQASARLLASMPYAVYRERGGPLLAVCAHASDAAALVSIIGDGAVISCSGPDGLNPSSILWIEGPMGDGSAGESYDGAASVMHARWLAYDKARTARMRAGA